MAGVGAVAGVRAVPGAEVDLGIVVGKGQDLG